MTDLTDTFRRCVYIAAGVADEDLLGDILSQMRRRGITLADSETMAAIRDAATLIHCIAREAAVEPARVPASFGKPPR